jgi:hypothetical protein
MRMPIAHPIGILTGIMLATLLAMTSSASGKEHLYVGVKKCRTCHKKELIGDQYGKWKKSPHAKAFEALKSDEALKIGKAKGIAAPSESDQCLKCHATAFGLKPDQMKKPLKLTDSVQCESCHGPGNDYRKKKIMSDRDKSIANGMWEPGKDEKICTTCHNDESPTWDTTKFKLADGSTVAFDFEQAKEKIAHPIPEDVKGRYVEIEKERRKGGKADEDDD